MSPPPPFWGGGGGDGGGGLFRSIAHICSTLGFHITFRWNLRVSNTYASESAPAEVECSFLNAAPKGYTA